MENKKIKYLRFKRAAIEVAFIVFLFYSNLLMGEYTMANNSISKPLLAAVENIFTPINFTIALIAAMGGHFIFQFLRKRF